MSMIVEMQVAVVVSALIETWWFLRTELVVVEAADTSGCLVVAPREKREQANLR